MSTEPASLETDSTTPPDQLSWRLRVGWAAGSVGTATLLNGIGMLLLFYLSTILGIEPVVAGGLIFASKIYDMFTDPVMGWVSDRTQSRLGRRRPYLLLGGIVCTIAMAMLFTNVDLEGTPLLAFVLLALLLYATGYTIFNVPYMAMPAEMTRNPHERSRLMSLRVIGINLGTIAGLALAPALITFFGDGAAAYQKTGWVLAGIVLVATTLAFFGTAGAHQTQRNRHEPPFKEQLRSAAGNRPFCLLITSKFAQLFGLASSGGSSLFLITMVLQRPAADLAEFFVTATIVTIFTMPVWLKISRALGKRNAYFIGVALFVLAKFTWLLATSDESDFFFLGRAVLTGLGTGGIILNAQSMLPDTMEHDFNRTGLRREGLFSALYSFVEKTAFALGPLVFGAILTVMGFESAAGNNQSPEALQGILLGVVWVPVIAATLSAVALIPYKLDLPTRR
jgi:GPH family glycoside/pentoside/hexuronide:cation symporter